MIGGGLGGAANQQYQIQLQIVKHIVLVPRCFVDNFLVFIIFCFDSMADRKEEWRLGVGRGGGARVGGDFADTKGIY